MKATKPLTWGLVSIKRHVCVVFYIWFYWGMKNSFMWLNVRLCFSTVFNTPLSTSPCWNDLKGCVFTLSLWPWSEPNQDTSHIFLDFRQRIKVLRRLLGESEKLWDVSGSSKKTKQLSFTLPSTGHRMRMQSHHSVHLWESARLYSFNDNIVTTLKNWGLSLGNCCDVKFRDFQSISITHTVK